MKDLSIILVSWNTRQILDDCLASIFRQTRDIDYEVFVVDNASADGSAAMVAARYPQVRLIRNKDNRGFAAANNQAMRQAEGRFILLLNSDTVVLDGALQKTCAFAAQHPEAGIIGCRVLNADGTLQPSCFMFPSVLNLFLQMTCLGRLFPRNRFFGRERMTWWDRTTVRQVDVVTGCFMLVRRDVIERIGLLDEDYFMYGEETDWCWRANRAGFRCLFYPDARIIHLGGASSRQIRPAMKLQLRASILLFMRKTQNTIAYWASCLLAAMFFLLRVPYWFGRGIMNKTERAVSFEAAKTYSIGFCKALRGADALRKK